MMGHLIDLAYEILRSFSLGFIDGTRQGGASDRAPLSVIWEPFNGQDRTLEPESGLIAYAGARSIAEGVIAGGSNSVCWNWLPLLDAPIDRLRGDRSLLATILLTQAIAHPLYGLPLASVKSLATMMHESAMPGYLTQFYFLFEVGPQALE